MLAAVLWGTTGTAQALGGAEGSPLTVGAIRLLIGSVGLLLVAGHQIRRPPVGWLALGAAAMAGYQVTFFSGVARAGVAIGTVVAIGTAPVIAGLLGWLVRGEPPTPRWWTATALAVAGVALIAWRPGPTEPIGVALAALAGVAYAVATLASKHLLDTMPPLAAMAAMFGVAAVILSPLLWNADLGWLVTGRGLTAGLWLGLGATTVAYALFALGLGGATVGQAATMGLAEPATATLLGVAVLAERPLPSAWLGVGLVAGALLLLTRLRSARVSV